MGVRLGWNVFAARVWRYPALHSRKASSSGPGAARQCHYLPGESAIRSVTQPLAASLGVDLGLGVAPGPKPAVLGA